jgi:hypothetical protein
VLEWIKGVDAVTLWWIRAGAAALVFVLVAGAFWWWVPKWQMRSITAGDPKDRADIEDNFRKTIGQALGGIAVLIGAWAAYYGTQQTLQVNREQARLVEKASHDQLVSQQVAKGFELLGQKGDDKDDKLVLRLGGIYALESVMNDKETDQYRVPVLEALCAFVRDRTKAYKGHDPPPTDVQAVLTVIGRRDLGAGRVDLSDAHIPDANLADAVLSTTNVIYRDVIVMHLGANLRGAVLSGADLSGADLTGADLSYTDLSGADLSRADLTGASLLYAHLSYAILSGAKITQAQLDKACGENATLPPDVTLKPCLPRAPTRP